jgi:hypothetical protein
MEIKPAKTVVFPCKGTRIRQRAGRAKNFEFCKKIVDKESIMF